VRNRGESVNPQSAPLTTLMLPDATSAAGKPSGPASEINHSPNHPVTQTNKLNAKPLDSNYNDTLDSTLKVKIAGKTRLDNLA
jgi:hypothetical protein